MKIKLSKSQWEFMGKKAGWMKTSEISHSCRIKVSQNLKLEVPLFRFDMENQQDSRENKIAKEKAERIALDVNSGWGHRSSFCPHVFVELRNELGWIIRPNFDFFKSVRDPAWRQTIQDSIAEGAELITY